MAPEMASDGPKHPKANKGSFGPDNPPPLKLKKLAEEAARAGGSPPPVKEVRPFQPVEGEGLLAAMRHVLVNDKTHDATEEQKEVRAWLRGSRPTFFAKKADLEKAELLAKAAKSAGGGGSGPGPEAAPTVPPPPPDLGTDACLELIDQLLGETP